MRTIKIGRKLGSHLLGCCGQHVSQRILLMTKTYFSNQLKSYRLFVFIFFLIVLSCATHVKGQATDQGSGQKSFLWSIETTKNTVYLLGSIHLMKPDAYPLSSEIEKAYLDSKLIVFEADISPKQQFAALQKVGTKGFYMKGQNLSQNISAKTYVLLKQRAAKAGMSMSQFDSLKPWLCAVTLVGQELVRLGFSPQYGIDAHFFNRAKQDKKKLVFLEDLEYQFNMLARMNIREQESFLTQTLKDLAVVETMASDMVRFWKSGNAQKLNSILKTSFKRHPEIYDSLLVQRNKRWVADIEKLIMQQNNVLVIVGAAHLVGTDGVLALLRQKGYVIQQK